MFADVGDWLMVKSNTEDRHTLRAEILAVHPGGQPPYSVRWLDDGREALVFPGPDAQVITAAQRHELNASQVARINRLQAEIIADQKRADRERADHEQHRLRHRVTHAATSTPNQGEAPR